MAPGLIKPPKSQRLPDIIPVGEVQQIIAATRVLSYRVFLFTLYSLGLRLGEGLRLQVGDMDATRSRVHIRDAKGNRDRFVPLASATHELLRRLWVTYRNPVLLFPNRHRGLKGATSATTPLDPGEVQTTLHQVIASCCLPKKTITPHSLRHSYICIGGAFARKILWRVACAEGQVSFRYRNAKTGKMMRRTVPGAWFLWLVLQHVLPKGFRRARNFGFLNPNCKRLIALVQVLLKFVPSVASAWIKVRAPMVCLCCGAGISAR